MDVIILERVPTVLRGELSRWLTPVGGGVHVGRVTSLVRDQLWQLAVAKAGQGRVIQLWQCRGEPGYAMRVHGLVNAQLVDDPKACARYAHANPAVFGFDPKATVLQVGQETALGLVVGMGNMVATHRLFPGYFAFT